MTNDLTQCQPLGTHGLSQEEQPKNEAQLHNLTPAQLQQTYKTLKVILSEEGLDHHRSHPVQGKEGEDQGDQDHQPSHSVAALNYRENSTKVTITLM